MKFVILSLTLCSLFIAGAYQINQAQIEFDTNVKSAETSQITLQNTIDNLPPSFFSDGSCESLEACAGSCDSVNACPLDLCYEDEPCWGVGEPYNCLPECQLLEAQANNPFNRLNHTKPTLS